MCVSFQILCIQLMYFKLIDVDARTRREAEDARKIERTATTTRRFEQTRRRWHEIHELVDEQHRIRRWWTVANGVYGVVHPS